MSEQAILDHYGSVIAAEQSYILLNRAALEQSVVGIPIVNNTLNRVIAGESARELTRPFTEPRESLHMLAESYSVLGIMQNKKQLGRLMRFIGQQMLPLTGLGQVGEPLYEADYSYKDVGQCDYAEDSFTESLEIIETDEQSPDSEISEIQVVHDYDGTPLFIKKNHLSHNALTLHPFKLKVRAADGTFVTSEDMIVPPGCIVGVETYRMSETNAVRFDYDVVYRTKLLDSTPKIHPQRLSPWAYNGYTDRALFAAALDNENGAPLLVNNDRLATVAGTTFEHFYHATEKVLEHCGIKYQPSPRADSLFRMSA